MPIIDMQRRHAVTYRIRLGEKDIPNGAPKRLEGKIRITSPNLAIISAFVREYGGEAKTWGKDFEVKLPVTELPILLLPGNPISQWYELWGGSVCQRRCDGYDQQDGEACVCPRDLDARRAAGDSCKPTTRLTVVVPTVEVLGVGMLVTHSWIAAETMPSAVDLAAPMLADGQAVPAILRVIQKTGAGKRYAFPQLEIIGISQTALEGGAAPAPLALTSGSTVPATKDQVADLFDAIKALDKDSKVALREGWTAARLPSITSTLSLADLARAWDLVQLEIERPRALAAGPSTPTTEVVNAIQ